MDRAQLGGLDDVGIGALFGLAGRYGGWVDGWVCFHSLLFLSLFYSIHPSTLPKPDYRFEVMGLLMHAHHLDETYHAGPHTISIPRMQPAQNAPAAEHIPHPVSDANFKKLVAIIRCAVPYTGMILSTRESAATRRELLQLGISQISAGSRTDVGTCAFLLPPTSLPTT